MLKVFRELYWLVRGVRVYALVGESGTGKSFRSKLVAQKYAIDLIVDDGLLIRDNSILAGKSAKREQAFLAAIKTALLDDPEHRKDIVRALERQKFKSILLLGTSEKMIYRIAERLNLPRPAKVIKIEEIATREEIDRALRMRSVEGKHVIPVPAIEIKKNYPQIFYDSIRVFLKKNFTPIPNPKLFEKAVVRPEYSKKGSVQMSEAALTQLVIHCIDEFNENIRIKKIAVRQEKNGYRLIITIDVPFGTRLSGHIHNLQQYIIENIEKYTGILVEEVNIIIDKISNPS
jgi:ABC-type dipeptide/oligopeptide/nickel transport system ATPase component